MSFYASLVGSATTSIKGIGIEAMRQGKQVSPDQRAHLIRYVSKDEIFAALKGINDNYTPGVDGYGAQNFNATWNVTKKEVIDVVQDFFEKGSFA